MEFYPLKYYHIFLLIVDVMVVEVNDRSIITYFYFQINIVLVYQLTQINTIVEI